jgi:predicted PurR-regulated permease PerM
MDSWTTIKRILAVALVVLAVVGILLMIGAIVGTWIINGQVSDLTVAQLDRVDMGIDRIVLVINQIDDQLDDINDIVKAIETAALSLGGVLEENSIVVNLIEELLGVELGSRAERAREAVGSIQSAADGIDNTLQTIDSLPFVSLLDNRPNLEVFGDVADGLEGFQTDAAEAREVVGERRTEIIQGGVSIVTERTSKLSGGIDNVQGLMGDVSSQLATLRVRIQETRDSFSRTLDLLTLLINLILLLTVLAFLSLFALSVSLFRRPEQSFRELVRWSGPEWEVTAGESPPEESQEAE